MTERSDGGGSGEEERSGGGPAHAEAGCDWWMQGVERECKGK